MYVRLSPPQAHLSAQRVDRLLLWSRLWLLRLAAWLIEHVGLSAPLERALHDLIAPYIARKQKLILTLITLKALRARPPRRAYAPSHVRLYRRAHFIRAAIGARLRKLCRARDVRANIAALLRLLENAETEIARCAQRLARGLTRHIGGLEPNALCAWAFLSSPCASSHGADTS